MAPDHARPDDRSNGWEDVAATFMAVRSRTGVAAVRTWARSVRPGGAVLDLGCGSGVPIAETLLTCGFNVHGVDASPSLVTAFRARFPHAAVVCEAVEDSTFFNRTFDGVVAIGLLFLLPESAQRDLIRRIAAALRPGGQFLFTAPVEPCRWTDSLTGRASQSLGAEAYGEALAEVGLSVGATDVDEGGNHYYAAMRPLGTR